jgi:hypothetical protein
MHLRSYIVEVKLFGLLILVADSVHAQEGFDKPLKKTVVDLGPSPYYRPSQHVRKKLTCYYYSSFAVKQYDEGQKGAEWLSIVPSVQAACILRHSKDERVYISPEWSGYFWGVKAALAFFSAADGDDGGVPFGVFDVRTGRKLFEDSSLLEYYQKKLRIKEVFRITKRTDHVPSLTYFRVVRAGCDLKTEQSDCWNRERTNFGIKQADSPTCSGYEKAEGIWESAVVYPVSVLLTDSPKIKAVDGPVFCWPTN